MWSNCSRSLTLLTLTLAIVWTDAHAQIPVARTLASEQESTRQVVDHFLKLQCQLEPVRDGLADLQQLNAQIRILAQQSRSELVAKKQSCSVCRDGEADTLVQDAANSVASIAVGSGAWIVMRMVAAGVLGAGALVLQAPMVTALAIGLALLAWRESDNVAEHGFQSTVSLIRQLKQRWQVSPSGGADVSSVQQNALGANSASSNAFEIQRELLKQAKAVRTADGHLALKVPNPDSEQKDREFVLLAEEDMRLSFAMMALDPIHHIRYIDEQENSLEGSLSSLTQADMDGDRTELRSKIEGFLKDAQKFRQGYREVLESEGPDFIKEFALEEQEQINAHLVDQELKIYDQLLSKGLRGREAVAEFTKALQAMYARGRYAVYEGRQRALEDVFSDVLKLCRQWSEDLRASGARGERSIEWPQGRPVREIFKPGSTTK